MIIVKLSKCSLKLYVVVDRESIREDMIPVHGLSLLLEVQSVKALFRILFGVGPLSSVLINNLSSLGYKLSDIDVIVLPINSNALIGSFHDIIRIIPNVTLVVSPSINIGFPDMNVTRVHRTVQLLDCCLVLPPLGPRGELVLAVNTYSGLVVVIPCSHVGLLRTIKHVISQLKVKEIYGIVGGFHLSVFDVLTFNDLKSLSRKLNVEVIIPLYCTGFKARDKVLKLLKGNYIHSLGAGCGLEYKF